MHLLERSTEAGRGLSNSSPAPRESYRLSQLIIFACYTDLHTEVTRVSHETRRKHCINLLAIGGGGRQAARRVFPAAGIARGSRAM